jgi:hypothetical protein
LIEALSQDSSRSIRARGRRAKAPFLQRWLTRYARRRLRKELEHYLRSPELQFTPFRRRSSRTHAQVFRSLVQVNVYRDDARWPRGRV